MGYARFISLYYFLNLSVPAIWLVAIYPPLRHLPGSMCSDMGFSGYLTQEQETALTVAASFALKYRSHATVDESSQKGLMLLKMLTVLLAFLSNQKNTGITLIVLYSLMFVAIQPPRFRGAQKIEHLNPMAMKNRVRSPETKEEARRVWVVAFWADWCEVRSARTRRL